MSDSEDITVKNDEANAVDTGPTQLESSIPHWARLVSPWFTPLFRQISTFKTTHHKTSSSLGFIGSARDQGTSTTALCAAIHSSQNLKHDTLIIDCNFRHPSLCQKFEIESPIGFSNSIKDAADIELATKSVDLPHLSVMTCGTASLKSLKGLKKRIKETLAQLLNRHQTVILDLPHAHSQVARIFGSQVDQVFVVANPTKLSQQKIRSATVYLAKQLVDVDGIFLNKHAA